jgi:hypothetical protein
MQAVVVAELGQVELFLMLVLEVMEAAVEEVTVRTQILQLQEPLIPEVVVVVTAVKVIILVGLHTLLVDLGL